MGWAVYCYTQEGVIRKNPKSMSEWNEYQEGMLFRTTKRTGKHKQYGNKGGT